MAATMASEAKISIKVLLHKEENRVLYAEADCNFVDSLFSFMTLPMGTIVRVLGKRADKKFEAPGSLNNLYQSLMDLPECYLAMEECKFMLLNPRSPSYDHCRKLKLKIDDTEPMKYFICEEPRCCTRDYVSRFSTCNIARCSYCGKLMNREVSFKDLTVSVDGDCIGGGMFVSDITTFIVTDDLCVMPYTPGCCIQLLIDLGITDTSHLEERTVDIGREQMLDLLKLALSFNSPLTYLVLHTTHPIRDLVHPRQTNFDQCNLNRKEGSTCSKMFLDVSLQKSTGKLLFAEAEEDFVDFVFGFLAIPLGAVIGMFDGTSLVCMENIYKSISNMSVGRFLKSKGIKNILFTSSVGQHYISKHQIFSLSGTSNTSSIYLAHSNVFDDNWWDTCFLTFSRPKEGSYVALKDPRIDQQFLKRTGMFMITDDLVITPSSSISTLDILKKLKVPLNDIEKHKVGIGLEEALRMLKASLTSWSTLTNGLEHQIRLNQEI